MTMQSLSRRCLSILLLTVAVATVACGGSVMDDAPQPAKDAQPRNAHNSNHAEEQKRLTWGSGWSLLVQPVYSGNTVRAGMGRIVVEEWAVGPGRLRYEFPAFTLSAVRAETLAQSEGLVRPKPATGTVSVSVLARKQPVFTPTPLWPGGEAEAPGAMLWLPLETMRSLRDRGEARLEVAPLAKGLTMRTVPAPGEAAVTLMRKASGEAILEVDGKPVRFPVVKLEDNRGATYTVIDSPQNPLVIRFRFGEPAVAGGRRIVYGAQSGYDVVGLETPSSGQGSGISGQ
jgi:hypothetical protein